MLTLRKSRPRAGGSPDCYLWFAYADILAMVPWLQENLSLPARPHPRLVLDTSFCETPVVRATLPHLSLPSREVLQTAPASCLAGVPGHDGYSERAVVLRGPKSRGRALVLLPDVWSSRCSKAYYANLERKVVDQFVEKLIEHNADLAQFSGE